MLTIIPAVRIVPRVPAATPRDFFSTAPMMALVFGEAKIPIPRPLMARAKMINHNDVSTPTKISKNSATQFNDIPTEATNLGSILSEIHPEIGVKIAIRIEAVMRMSPAASGVKSLIYCR